MKRLIEKVFDHTDKHVAEIYDKPITKIDEVNKTIQSVTRILNKPDTTYHIGRAMGVIK